LRIVARHDVAMTVRQDRRQIVVLVPFREEKRRTARRVVEEAADEAQYPECGCDVLLQVR
jgi:hypothetical protein